MNIEFRILVYMVLYIFFPSCKNNEHLFILFIKFS